MFRFLILGLMPALAAPLSAHAETYVRIEVREIGHEPTVHRVPASRLPGGYGAGHVWTVRYDCERQGAGWSCTTSCDPGEVQCARELPAPVRAIQAQGQRTRLVVRVTPDNQDPGTTATQLAELERAQVEWIAARAEVAAAQERYRLEECRRARDCSLGDDPVSLGGLLVAQAGKTLDPRPAARAIGAYLNDVAKRSTEIRSRAAREGRPLEGALAPVRVLAGDSLTHAQASTRSASEHLYLALDAERRAGERWVSLARAAGSLGEGGLAAIDLAVPLSALGRGLQGAGRAGGQAALAGGGSVHVKGPAASRAARASLRTQGAGIQRKKASHVHRATDAIEAWGDRWLDWEIAGRKGPAPELTLPYFPRRYGRKHIQTETRRLNVVLVERWVESPSGPLHTAHGYRSMAKAMAEDSGMVGFQANREAFELAHTVINTSDGLPLHRLDFERAWRQNGSRTKRARDTLLDTSAPLNERALALSEYVAGYHARDLLQAGPKATSVQWHSTARTFGRIEQATGIRRIPGDPFDRTWWQRVHRYFESAGPDAIADVQRAQSMYMSRALDDTARGMPRPGGPKVVH